jgi:HAD superfamily hydrolase (TIGR01509 family)
MAGACARYAGGMAIRAVIFDLFDTLVDLLQENLPLEEHHGAVLPASVRALHAVASRRGPVPFDAFTRAMLDGSRDFAETHFARGREVPTLLRFQDLTRRLALDDVGLPGVLTEVHMGILRAQVRSLPHHVEVLAAVRRRARLGLCSNFSHSETALGVLDQAGLRPHLDAVVISDAFGLRKPRPEIFEEALARLSVAAEEAVHVGDNLRVDVVGAAALGIRTIWLTRRIPDPEAALHEHEGARPDLVLADLAELPDALAGLA